MCACVCTTFENGVLRNGQQPGRAENSFIDQDEFVAMKMLSSCKAPCGDKHQFRDKMTVTEYLNCFQDIVVEHCGVKKERKKNEKNGIFTTAHFRV